MEEILDLHSLKIGETKLDFVRPMISFLEEKERLIGLKGSRGVGKSTLLLQYLKKQDKPQSGEYLYASLDHIWFLKNTAYGLAKEFYKRGGKILALDEVHRYPNWSQELKNINDDFKGLKVVFTGSSLLEILNARADLSRRAVVYPIQGLSFREFVRLQTNIEIPSIKLEDLLKDHAEITMEINKKIKPYAYLDDYLSWGYYPFYLEHKNNVGRKIEEIINMILEIELPLLRQTDISYARKLKLLLLILAESAPFVPNISKLAEKIEINRKTLLIYIQLLEEANLIKTLQKDSKGISRFQKPDKLLPENTNISIQLSSGINKGTIRETFFVNQISYQHEIEYSEIGDYKVDRQYIFEIGGKTKKGKQLEESEGSYLVLDDIEYGYSNKIPLWLFGFLY